MSDNCNDEEKLTTGICGVDIGASLAKIVTVDSEANMHFELFRAQDVESILWHIDANKDKRVGVTGGGANKLKARLGSRLFFVEEFNAWGVGANRMAQGKFSFLDRPYLLVCMGTGTSVMIVNDKQVKRIGGTALGGGTVLGLGRALVGDVGFEELCHLAANGNSSEVDLRIKDIYSEGGSHMDESLTASNFGKLSYSDLVVPSRADLAAALMRLVGENVALIAVGLAKASQIEHIVLAGSTLRSNPLLSKVVNEACATMGFENANLLPNGEFAGALGAYLLAAQAQ